MQLVSMLLLSAATRTWAVGGDVDESVLLQTKKIAKTADVQAVDVDQHTLTQDAPRAPGGWYKVAARCNMDAFKVQTVGFGHAPNPKYWECFNLANAEEATTSAFEFDFTTGVCKLFDLFEEELPSQVAQTFIASQDAHLAVHERLALASKTDRMNAGYIADSGPPCDEESCCYGLGMGVSRRALKEAEGSGYSQLRTRCKPDGENISEELTGKTFKERFKQCQDRCDAEATCTAFEFVATGECKLVLGVDFMKSLEFERCNAHSCCYWKPRAAPTGYSMVHLHCTKVDTDHQWLTGKTFEQCQAHCNAEVTCTAFEFKFATGECEMVSVVDKGLFSYWNDHECTGSSCCYQKTMETTTMESACTKHPFCKNRFTKLRNNIAQFCNVCLPDGGNQFKSLAFPHRYQDQCGDCCNAACPKNGGA